MRADPDQTTGHAPDDEVDDGVDQHAGAGDEDVDDGGLLDSHDEPNSAQTRARAELAACGLLAAAGALIVIAWFFPLLVYTASDEDHTVERPGTGRPQARSTGTRSARPR